MPNNQIVLNVLANLVKSSKIKKRKVKTFNKGKKRLAPQGKGVKHIKSNPKIIEKPYQCPICDKNFIGSNEMENHII